MILATCQPHIAQVHERSFEGTTVEFHHLFNMSLEATWVTVNKWSVCICFIYVLD